MTYRLRLYITGRTSHSIRAIENLRKICDSELKGQYEVEVIDILENPRLAENEKILATPTLVKKLPEPVRKIIGDLSDREKVLLGLDIFSADRVQRDKGAEL
ncbi:MAG: circadian clock protein KaiB [Xanthobacteraceae bacterium]